MFTISSNYKVINKIIVDKFIDGKTDGAASILISKMSPFLDTNKYNGKIVNTLKETRTIIGVATDLDKDGEQDDTYILTIVPGLAATDPTCYLEIWSVYTDGNSIYHHEPHSEFFKYTNVSYTPHNNINEITQSDRNEIIEFADLVMRDDFKGYFKPIDKINTDTETEMFSADRLTDAANSIADSFEQIVSVFSDIDKIKREDNTYNLLFEDGSKITYDSIKSFYASFIKIFTTYIFSLFNKNNYYNTEEDNTTNFVSQVSDSAESSQSTIFNIINRYSSSFNKSSEENSTEEDNE